MPVFVGTTTRPVVAVAAAVVATGDIDPGWSSQFDSWLRTLVVDHQGGLYVGGDFTSVNGVYRRSIAKLSAATGDPEATWDAMVDCCTVAAIAIGANDEIYVGGNFAHIGGQSRGGLARLSSASGAADIGWDPDTNGSVYALAVNPHGDVYAGGQFSTIGGQSRYLVAKLSGTGSGSAFPGWYANLQPVYEPNYLLYNVSSIATDSHGTAYLTGFFGVGEEPPFERSIARFSGENGLVDLDWRPLPGGGYWNYAIAVADDRLYVGGAFAQAGGQPRRGVAAFATTLPDRLFAADFEQYWPP